MSLETFNYHITSIDDLEAVIGLPTHREKIPEPFRILADWPG
ncbi:MAG: hypothetical protein ACKVHO_18485 [Verrucomicrobiia bacterium]|jgi:hypothetical protein